MTRCGSTSRRFRPLLVLATGALLLGGCTVDLDADPTPTAGPTAVVFGPNDVAVGGLVDEGREAWESVDAWTAETRIDSAEAAEGSASSATTERVILPGSRHVLTTNNETVVTEEIVVDGRVYMRGTLVSSSIYPDASPETWITFSADIVPTESVLAQRVEQLTAPPAYPFASVTDETRALPARPSGEIQVDDRTCMVWRFTTATAQSEGIEHRIAFDGDGRPCQLVRESGGVVETTTWRYPSEPEPIEAPGDAVRVDAFPGAP